MTRYIHHIPGRLRIRSKVFLRNSARQRAAVRELHALDGVTTVRVNNKAGSVTVCYEVEMIDVEEILLLLEDHGCSIAAAPAHEFTQTAPAREMTQAAPPVVSTVAAMFGKMLVGKLMEKGVSYSVSTLLGSRI